MGGVCAGMVSMGVVGMSTGMMGVCMRLMHGYAGYGGYGGYG